MPEMFESFHLVGDVIRTIEAARAEFADVTLEYVMGPELWSAYVRLDERGP